MMVKPSKYKKQVPQKRSGVPNEGVRAYNSIGKIFIICGLVSTLLLSFVSLLPQDYEKYDVSLYFTWWAVISFGLILLGALPLILGKTSARYQAWIDKEWRSYKNKYGRK